MSSIVFIVACMLLGGLAILYGIYKYSEKGIHPQRHEKLDKTKKKEYTLLEQEARTRAEIHIAIIDVLWEESLSWLKQYSVGYVIFVLMGLLSCALFPFPPIVETNMALLSAIATCISIAYALVSFFIFRPSFLFLSHRLGIAFVNTFHLGLFAYVLYLLASKRLPYEVQIAYTNTLYLMFVMTIYTCMFLILCALVYQEKAEDRRFLQSTSSLHEKILECGLTVQEFIKKTNKKLGRVGIDVEEFVRKEEEMANKRKRRTQEEDINHD